MAEGLPSPEYSAPSVTPPVVEQPFNNAGGDGITFERGTNGVVATISAEAMEWIDRERAIASFRAMMIAKHPQMKDAIEKQAIRTFELGPEWEKKTGIKRFIVVQSGDGNVFWYTPNGEERLNLRESMKNSDPTKRWIRTQMEWFGIVPEEQGGFALRVSIGDSELSAWVYPINSPEFDSGIFALFLSKNLFSGK